MQIEITEAGKKAESDLLKLHSQEFGRGQYADYSVGSTILKILTLMAGIFFSMISATTLPPEMAFISITLIAVATFAILAGAEKIIAIFPRNIWIWKSHYPTYYDPAPPPPRSWTSWRPSMPSWGRGNSSRNSGGHSVSSSRSSGNVWDAFCARSSSNPWWRPSSSYTNRSGKPERTAPGGGHSNGPVAGGTNKVARGGGHVGSPIAGGTGGRVAVGGGHDRRETTSSGKVIPGSRGSRK